MAVARSAPLPPISALTLRPVCSASLSTSIREANAEIACRQPSSSLMSFSMPSTNSPISGRGKPSVDNRCSMVAITGRLPALSCHCRSPKAACSVSRKSVSSRFRCASAISLVPPTKLSPAGRACSIADTDDPVSSMAQISTPSAVRLFERMSASDPMAARTCSKASLFVRPVKRCTFIVFS